MLADCLEQSSYCFVLQCFCLSSFRDILSLTVPIEPQTEVQAVPPNTSDDDFEFGEDDKSSGQGDQDSANDQPTHRTSLTRAPAEEKLDDDDTAPRKWKESQFWSYVDVQLVEVRELTTAHVRDKKDQDAKITECVSICHTCSHDLSPHRFFTTCLQDDWKQYPNSNKFSLTPIVGSSPSWQQIIQENMAW